MLWKSKRSRRQTHAHIVKLKHKSHKHTHRHTHTGTQEIGGKHSVGGRWVEGCGWWLGAVAVVAKATRSQEAARTLCYKFYELATGSDAVSVLGYVCVCVAHKNKLHSCHDSHHHPHLPPVFAIKIRELFSLCLCAFGFSNCICVCGCLLAVSQSAIVAAAPSAPQFHHPHYPTPPPTFPLVRVIAWAWLASGNITRRITL